MKIRNIILISLISLILIRFFVLDICRVSGGSMASTLYHNDLVVFVRKGLFYKTITRFDINVLSIDNKLLDNSNGFLIKRLIGMPGEIIDFKDSAIYIDGNIIDNPKLSRFNYSLPDSIISYERIVDILPYHSVINYNRLKSQYILNFSNSERETFINASFLISSDLTLNEEQGYNSNSAKLFSSMLEANDNKEKCFSQSLLQPLGFTNQTNEKKALCKQYFYIGDNRPFSTDSRILGCITKESVIGKVLFLLFRNNNGKIEMFKALYE